MVGKVILAIILAVVAVGAYYATLPVPEGLPNPWKLRFHAAVSALVGIYQITIIKVYTVIILLYIGLR